MLLFNHQRAMMPTNKRENKMTKKELSPQAKTAKAIRKELKASFPQLKVSVTSEAFSMGDAVRVSILTEETIETVEKIRELVSKYQYGSFNGMTDSYDYTNCRDDIPQVKWVSVYNY